MCVCVTAWQWCLTSTEVGCYMLQLVYLTDGLSPGEVEDQDPVPWGYILQPAAWKTVTSSQIFNSKALLIHMTAVAGI